ncbi:MAG: hypothetical protein ABUL64_04640 [Singulisphaera sp.]
MKFFLAGIMQGSHLGPVIHNQDYRARVRGLLEQYIPEAEVYDPLADHANSLEYDDQRGREVFFHHNRLCAEVDVLLAFVPEASMGTAIEMWQAYCHGKAVIAISPLVLNWTVRYLSHQVYATVEEFEESLACGAFARRLTEIRSAQAAAKASPMR